ncbi:MAG: amino acid adenylation domain-containing protein [Cytophagales bacterium]|nr:amino acid adenylation domain-containing protein [Cytophagales bacterium]
MDILDLFSKLNELGVRLSAKGAALEIIDPKNGLSEELKVLIKENESEILDLLEDFDFPAPARQIDKAESKDHYQLSSAQKRLYFIQEFDKTSIAYNLSQVVRIEGAIDKPKLEGAFRNLVDRHEVLRTSFVQQGQEIVQQIHDEFDLEITYFEGGASDIDGLVKSFIRPFDLAFAPLIRIGIIKISEQDHVLMVDTHHIICDGASEGILISDFVRLYQEEELPELSIQFKDYSEWQESESHQSDLLTQGNHWREVFSEPLNVLELPRDHARPRLMDRSGGKTEFTLDARETTELNRLAREEGTTLFTVLFSALNILLSKLGNQDDIVIGIPTAGRNHAGLEQLIGMFVNTLVLRNHPKGELTFKSFLAAVNENTLEAFENQSYQYESLIDMLQVSREPNRNPLFDVMFVFQNNETQELKIPGATLKYHPITHQTSKFDLTFFVTEIDKGLRFELEFSTELFLPDTAERFLKCLRKVVDSILNNSGIKLSAIDLLSVEERFQLLDQNNTSGIGYPTTETLNSLFDRQVATHHDRVALSYHGEELTYASLNARANQLAGYLINHGVTMGSIVGLLLDDPVDQIVAILATLKASGCYLPIDTSHPEERIGYMLKDSNCQTVLTSAIQAIDRQELLDPYQVILVTDDEISRLPITSIHSAIEGSDLAYIIYTSGTTGRPKGAMVEHKQVVRLFFNEATLFDFGPEDVWTMFHAYSFDFSVWEIFGALLHGSKLVLLSREDTRDPALFHQLLAKHGVTILNQTPTAFQSLQAFDQSVKESSLSVRKVIFGGEQLNPATIRPWHEKYPASEMINMYGITETTVHVTYKLLTTPDFQSKVSNIGCPIPTTQIYILDDQLNLCLPGVKGEMYVGGDGVCRGYINNTYLTSEKFISNPFRADERLYKTGDAGRWLANGELEYLGRIDHQVQVRGYRIELGEIETHLQSYPEIREVAVTSRGEGAEVYLVGYYASDAPISVDLLRTHLSAQLPGYMIPSFFVQLDQLPLTSNGKVDFKALPDDFDAEQGSYEPPQNEAEVQLAQIWSEALKVEKIGRNDNYFALGGDSIKVINIVSRINQFFSSQVRIADVFTHQTIAQIATLIPTRSSENQENELRNEVLRHFDTLLKEYQAKVGYGHLEDVYPMSDIQKGMIFHSIKEEGVYHDQMSNLLKMKHFDAEVFRKALGLMVEKHPMLRTSFSMDEEEPLQFVHENGMVDYVHQDLGSSSADEQKQIITTQLEEDKHSGFDLSRPGVWRYKSYSLGDNNYILCFIFHHAIIDGWSNASFSTELHETYYKLLEDQDFAPAQLKSTYKDLIVEQRIRRESKASKEFWQEELADYNRFVFDETEDFQVFEQLSFDISDDTLVRLSSYAKAHHLNVKSVCYAAFLSCIKLYSFNSDLTTGLITNNRPEVEDGDKVLGCFLNTVPFRYAFQEEKTWHDLVKGIHDKLILLKGYDHLSLHEISSLVEDKSDHTNPIVDVIFNFVDFHVYEALNLSFQDSDELRDSAKVLHAPFEAKSYERTNFGMAFTVSTTEGQLSCSLSYLTSFMSHRLAKDFLSIYESTLKKIIDHPEDVIDHQSILPAALAAGLGQTNSTRTIGYPTSETLVTLFETQVEKHADRIALSYHGNEVSYADLNARANQIAGYLKTKGVQRESIVGLLLDDPVDQVVSILGVLKASGGYLPIDPTLPEERVGYMLKDSNCQVVLTQELLATSKTELLTPYEVINVSDELIRRHETCNLPSDNESKDLAYIIYTSGTTGRPKGAMIEHRQVVRLFFNDAPIFDFDEKDVWTLFHSYGFDFSVWEMYGALLYGGKLVLLTRDEARDTATYHQLLRAHEVTILNQTPTAFQSLLKIDQSHPESSLRVRKVIFGGEKLIPSAIRSWQERYPTTEMINMYGITETTVHVTYKHLSESDLSSAVSNIGKPIPTTQVYILDEQGNFSLPGVKGELFVGGDGVCRGYLNNDSLTAEKFIEDPHQRTRRIYKTGDMARWLPSGDIAYLGRGDDQVKIRGFRIELGEIENCLSAHASIHEAVVVIKEQGSDKVLVSYFRANKELSSSEVRDFLAERLPAHMVPTYHVQVDEFQMTRIGKLNRKALPDPDMANGVTYTAPGTEIERQLVGIWSEVLSLDKTQIGIDHEFFDLGGHSLKMMTLANKITSVFGVTVSVKDLFSHLDIRSQANHIEALDLVAGSNRIPKAQDKSHYVTSSAQQRLYFLHQFNRKSTAYNMPYALRLSGELEINKLEASFQSLIARHEILRTSIVMLEGEVVQQPFEAFKFAIESYESDEHDLDKTMRHFVRPFDLSNPPLLRAGLVEVSSKDHLLMVDMHHIVSDGASQDQMIREFMQLYQGDPLSEPLLQYKDYAEWQRLPEIKDNLSAHKAYWLEEFSDEVPALELPPDHARPIEKDYSGATAQFDLMAEEIDGLKELSRVGGTTMFMTFLSYLYVLLSKLSNEEDIVIGTPIAGRNHADLEKIQGMFVNSLALRNYPRGEFQFLDFLTTVKENVLTCFDHQDYQYEALIEALDLQRTTNRNPLFDVMFSYEYAEGTSLTLPGLAIESVDSPHEVAKFDLTFIVSETENGIRMHVNYSTELFAASTIAQFVTYFREIIATVTANAEIQLSEIEILSEDQKRELLEGFNATQVAYPNKSIAELFENQVISQKDRVALIAGERQISYQDLNARSNQIARVLQSCGIEKEELVGVYADRSIEAVAGILGILKSGGAYLPLDVDYPEDRLSYMLEDSGSRVVLCIGEFPPTIGRGRQVLDLISVGTDQPTDNLKNNGSSEQLAYVMYTSGTTGTPKGVQVDQKSVVRLVHGQNYMQLKEEDRVLSLSNFSFDGFTFDLYMPLLNGGALVLPDEDIFLDLPALDSLISGQAVDSFFLTTALFNALVDAELGSLKRLKYLLFGGEQVSVPHVSKFKALFPDVNIHHVYGPTENTTFSTWFEISEVSDNDVTIPIGSGISNSTCFVLDAHQKLVPKGVRGELYLGGDGVSRGYLNNTSLTDRKFIDNPYRPGDRLYKTGDMVRWTDEGQIAFIGRVDDQLKIRGFRIELGEIKSQLLGHGSVLESEVVVIDHEGDKVLAAYFTTKEDLTIDSLRSFMSKQLPDYMIPAHFKQLDEFPLTANGKVNKKALPKISVQCTEDYVAPDTVIEIQLAELWSEVLKIEKEKIGVNQSFFDLGGHSLKAMALCNKVSKDLAVRLPVKDLFLHQDIRSLASHIEGLSSDNHVAISSAPEKPYYVTSSAQQRLHFLYEFDKLSLAYNMPQVVRLRGQVDKSKLESTFIALIERHEIFRTAIERLESELVQRPIDRMDFGIEDFEPDGREVGEIISNFIRPFDLSKPPLLRVGLIRLSSEENIMMIDMHHIISDGVSQKHLISDFMRIYEGEWLEKPRLQYKDYAEWQQSATQQANLNIQRNFWLGEFEEEVGVLHLPTDHARPKVKDYQGNLVNFSLTSEEVSGLRAINQGNDTTMFMTLLGVLNVLLSKLSNEQDIVIGTPTAGRNHVDLEEMQGMFVNTLAIRNHPHNQLSFKAFLEEVKQKVLSCFDHQDFQYEDLVEALGLTRDTSRNPLFDVMFSYQNFEGEQLNIPGLTLLPESNGHEVAKFDLTFTVSESDDKLEVMVSYSTQLFEAATIKRFIAYFKRIISSVIEDVNILLGDIDVIDEQEKQQQLLSFNDTSYDYPKDKTVIDLFELNASLVPDRPALIFHEEVLSYKEFQSRVNKLTSLLIKRGVASGDVIGIMCDRSPDLVVGIYSILKAGAAYLPIDPQFPKARIDYCLEDSGATFLLLNSASKSQINAAIPTQELDEIQYEALEEEHIVSRAKPENLAYIIYTSGSTGQPKGVMIEHKSLMGRLHWVQQTYPIDHKDVLLQKTTSVFDVSVRELFWWSQAGASLCILPSGDEKDPILLSEAIDKYQVSMINFVPSMLEVFLNHVDHANQPPRLNSLKHVFSGGEALKKSQVRAFKRILNDLNQTRLTNFYGPTETTINATYFDCLGENESLAIPIGKPLGNTTVLVLNKTGKLQPSGVPGELCIGGVGLARGYLNKEELTDEKFVEHPYAPGERLYKTGDIVRWLADGNIEYRGRSDEQTNLKGLRVELGEIEYALSNHDGIKQAVVLTNGENDSAAIVGYYVSEAEFTASALRNHLELQLPKYMIPAHFVHLQELPITTNGKLDQKALPEVSLEEVNTYRSPATATEIRLTEIWSEVLELETDKISVDHSFFDLGGSSLKATSTLGRINKEFDTTILVKDFFQSDTIQKLGELIEIVKWSNNEESEQKETTTYEF